jgi:hypothetical protein
MGEASLHPRFVEAQGYAYFSFDDAVMLAAALRGRIGASRMAAHSRNIGAEFERTMRPFLGHDAYQTAGLASNPRHRADLIRRTLRKTLKSVDSVETDL